MSIGFSYFLEILQKNLSSVNDTETVCPSDKITYRSDPFKEKLLPGQIVEGKVRAKANNMTFIETDQGLLKAKGNIDVPKGAFVKLKVIEGGYPAKVKVESWKSERQHVASKINQLLAKSKVNLSRLEFMVENIDFEGLNSIDTANAPFSKVGLQKLFAIIGAGGEIDEQRVMDTVRLLPVLPKVIKGLVPQAESKDSSGPFQNNSDLNTPIKGETAGPLSGPCILDDAKTILKKAAIDTKPLKSPLETTALKNLLGSRPSAVSQGQVVDATHNGMAANKSRIYAISQEDAGGSYDRFGFMEEANNKGIRTDYSCSDKKVDSKMSHEQDINTAFSKKDSKPSLLKQKVQNESEIVQRPRIQGVPFRLNEPEVKTNSKLLFENTIKDAGDLDTLVDDICSLKGEKGASSEGRGSHVVKSSTEGQAEQDDLTARLSAASRDSGLIAKGGKADGFGDRPSDQSVVHRSEVHTQENCEPVQSFLKGLATQLELAQEIHGHLFHKGIDFLLVPFLFSQFHGVGQWVFWQEEAPNKDGRVKGQTYHLFFDLSLKNLGKLDIHLFKRGDILFISVWAEEDKVQAIRLALSDLASALKAAGFQLGDIEVSARGDTASDSWDNTLSIIGVDGLHIVT